MKKIMINPPTVAPPSGYSQAILTEGGRILFLAGQTSMDKAGVIQGRGDMVQQFALALENMKRVMEAAGGSMTDIVKFTLYVTDRQAYLDNLKPIGEIYRSYFGRYYPVMTFVEIKSLFDDGAMIEIDATAVLPEGARA